MKIVWNQNPMKTVVELNDDERKILRLRLKVEELEERILAAHMELDPKHQEWAQKHLQNVPTTVEGFVEAARRRLDYAYVAGDEKHGDRSFEDRLDELTAHYVEELAGEHMGDCTCVPASCSKCYAEHLMGIDTIDGLGKHPESKISGMFSSRDGTEPIIDQVLERLRTYEPVNTNPNWPDAEFAVHIPRWKREAQHAYEWLLDYRKTKLPG